MSIGLFDIVHAFNSILTYVVAHSFPINLQFDLIRFISLQCQQTKCRITCLCRFSWRWERSLPSMHTYFNYVWLNWIYSLLWLKQLFGNYFDNNLIGNAFGDAAYSSICGHSVITQINAYTYSFQCECMEYIWKIKETSKLYCTPQSKLYFSSRISHSNQRNSLLKQHIHFCCWGTCDIAHK